jgi:hypothetical protein
MTLLARHPFSSSVVLAALAATAFVFLFARPEYHPAGQGTEVKLDLSKYPPAAHSWTWEDGQPGFRFADDNGVWNLSQVEPAELAPVRVAARRWGVASHSVRLIDAIRLGPRDLTMIVAGTNAADHTCLGFVMPSEAPAFYCGERLDAVSAFVLVTTRGPFASEGKTVHPTFLTGIANGDVTRVVAEQQPDWPHAGVYDRKQGSPWGTFQLSFSDSHGIRVSAYGRNGLVASVPIDIVMPGDRLLTIRG